MEQTPLYPFIVIDVSNSQSKGLGTHSFRAPPHHGEYITVEDEGIAYAYEVVTVIHPFEPTVTCGDLIIRRIGTDIELRKSLKDLHATGT